MNFRNAITRKIIYSEKNLQFGISAEIESHGMLTQRFGVSAVVDGLPRNFICWSFWSRANQQPALVERLIQPFDVSAAFDESLRNFDEDNLGFRRYILIEERALYDRKKAIARHRLAFQMTHPVESCVSNDSPSRLSSFVYQSSTKTLQSVNFLFLGLFTFRSQKKGIQTPCASLSRHIDPRLAILTRRSLLKNSNLLKIARFDESTIATTLIAPIIMKKNSFGICHS